MEYKATYTRKTSEAKNSLEEQVNDIKVLCQDKEMIETKQELIEKINNKEVSNVMMLNIENNDKLINELKDKGTPTYFGGKLKEKNEVCLENVQFIIE